jgi:lipid A 3-O-deacylase
MGLNRVEIGLSFALAGRLLLATVFAHLVLMPVTASAQSKIVDEVKGGVLAHDVTLGGRHVESGADINGEVLFTSPDFLAVIGAPRPHLGAEVNTDGNTDNAYFGLTWGLPIVKSIVGATDALTIYGSLGGSVNDGYQDSAPPGRKKLGSPVLFRESVELGYQVTPVNSLSILVDHISNANLANHNAGITNVGARLGFKF